MSTLTRARTPQWRSTKAKRSWASSRCARRRARSTGCFRGRPSGPSVPGTVEGAGGLGYLLAQQLVSVGETVLDVRPKLGSRVRLLATGNVNKNDPNDARSVPSPPSGQKTCDRWQPRTMPPC